MNPDSVKKVVDFILSKKKLRCLDFSDIRIRAAGLLPLVRALRSLPGLEVLGVDLGYSELTAQAFRDLKRAMPRSLTALRLWFNYGKTAVRNDCSLVHPVHYLPLCTRN